jgi:hypothetical protein
MLGSAVKPMWTRYAHAFIEQFTVIQYMWVFFLGGGGYVTSYRGWFVPGTGIG